MLRCRTWGPWPPGTFWAPLLLVFRICFPGCPLPAEAAHRGAGGVSSACESWALGTVGLTRPHVRKPVVLVTSASSRCLLLGPLPCWSLSTGTVGWKKSHLFRVRGPSPMACRAEPVDRANEPRKGVSAPAAVLGRTARAGPLSWSGDGVLGPGRKACPLQTQCCVFKLVWLLPRGVGARICASLAAADTHVGLLRVLGPGPRGSRCPRPCDLSVVHRVLSSCGGRLPQRSVRTRVCSGRGSRIRHCGHCPPARGNPPAPEASPSRGGGRCFGSAGLELRVHELTVPLSARV